MRILFHALEALRGVHEDMAIVHHKVAAFGELDAHLLRAKRMFEAGGVADAGCKQHATRRIDPVWNPSTASGKLHVEQ